MDFDIVFHALETVLTFFIIGCIGFVLAKRGWFQVESQLMLSRLVTIVALPPLLLYNISSSFTRDELLHLLYGSLVPFTSISFTLCLGWLAARVFNVPHSRRGVFCASFSFSNTIYIGLPVNLALFGEGALPYVLLYYIGHTILFWTVGNYAIAADGEKENEKLLSLGTLKKNFLASSAGLFCRFGACSSGYQAAGFSGQYGEIPGQPHHASGDHEYRDNTAKHGFEQDQTQP